MSKLNLMGLILCVGGLVLVVFQAVSSMMTAGEIVWKSLNIIGLVDPSHLKWIDSISVGSLKNLLWYIVKMPLYLLLLGSGIFCLIVGGLTQK